MLLERVVIGSSVESALYAYLYGCHHIQTCNTAPLFFEEFNDFSLFGTNNKREIWRKLKIMLGMLALNLDFMEVKKIRILKNKIKIFDNNLVGEFQFKKCYIFNPDKVSHENKILNTKEKKWKVIDDFKISRIGKNIKNVPTTELGGDLVSKIYFYNSMRVDGAKGVTDVITVSDLTKEQLYDFDYSDTMAMFKLKRALNSMGFHGILERTKNKNGTNKYKKIVLKHVSRRVYPVDNNLYAATKDVVFLDKPVKEIVSDFITER